MLGHFAAIAVRARAELWGCYEQYQFFLSEAWGLQDPALGDVGVIQQEMVQLASESYQVVNSLTFVLTGRSRTLWLSVPSPQPSAGPSRISTPTPLRADAPPAGPAEPVWITAAGHERGCPCLTCCFINQETFREALASTRLDGDTVALDEGEE